MKLLGRRKSILVILMLCGPAVMLILLSKGQQNFVGLESLAKLNGYQFYDLDSNLISDKANDKEVIVFTTIQNTCFDNANKDCSIYPYFIEEFFYRDYFKSPKKYKNVKIYSIVTDKLGNPARPSALLIDAFSKYDRDFWELVVGDPKQVYSFKNKEGIVFSDIKDKDGNFEFIRMGLLVNMQNEIKAIRPLNGEAFVREFNERYRMLIKESTIKKYNESR